MSLEMQDPQKVFAERIVKSVISIIPGVGFFQKKLCKLAKVDFTVCTKQDQVSKGDHQLHLCFDFRATKSLNRRSDS